MATVNLGSIKFKWKGTYSGATAYTIDDVVEYNGSSYICILASTGNLPTNATYFEQMSSAGTNGTDLTTTLTTQGDLLYRDGSGLQRLGAGTSGQVLQTGGAGANPSWADSSGGIISTGGFSAGQNIWTYKWNDQSDISTQWTSSTDITGSTWNLGQALTENKKCIVSYSVVRYEQNWNHSFIRFLYATNSAGNNWDYIESSDQNVHSEHFAPATSSGSDHLARSTATYVLDFTTGQYPSFKMNGGRFGGSNNLKVNYDMGNDGTIYSYYTAWFV
jgi:hypothetical protein